MSKKKKKLNRPVRMVVTCPTTVSMTMVLSGSVGRIMVIVFEASTDDTGCGVRRRVSRDVNTGRTEFSGELHSFRHRRSARQRHTVKNRFFFCHNIPTAHPSTTLSIRVFKTYVSNGYGSTLQRRVKTVCQHVSVSLTSTLIRRGGPC